MNLLGNQRLSTTKARELTGWLGVLLILLAYSLVTLEVLHPSSTLYGVMNLFGALGIIASSYSKRDFQPVFLNLVWLLVAAIGIFKSLA